MSRASELLAFAKRDPGNSVLLCDLLDELLSTGRVDDAIEHIGGVPAALRELPGVRFREARCALLRGDSKGAIELLRPLLASMRDVPSGVVHDLAYAQFAQGQSAEALQTLAHAHMPDGDVIALALLKARILHRQQQLDTALEVLAPIQSGVRLPEVQGLRALLWLDMGETERASAEAELALVRISVIVTGCSGRS